MPLCGSPEWKRYPVALSVHWIAAAVPMQGCESAESHLPANQRVMVACAAQSRRCVVAHQNTGPFFRCSSLPSFTSISTPTSAMAVDSSEAMKQAITATSSSGLSSAIVQNMSVWGPQRHSPVSV